MNSITKFKRGALLTVASWVITGVTFQTNAQERIAEQEVLNPKDFVEVTKPMMQAIQKWQNKGVNQKQPLDQFLSSQRLTRSEKQQAYNLVNRIKQEKRSSGTDCNCIVTTVNSSYDVAPSYSHQYSPPESQGGLTTWYKEQIYGAATRQRMQLNSPTTNNEFEHGESISGDEVSSNSYGRLSFNYLCTDGSMLPADCGCDKIIYLRANYYNKSWVSTSAKGGWGTHSCFAAVEDDVALFAIDQYQTQTNVQVLKGGQFLLSRAQDDTWNPDFWFGVVDLASSIAGVVEDYDSGIDWSETIADLGDQIVNVFQTPVDIHYQEEEDGSENKTFAMNYDGGVTLSPNHIVHVNMISKGYIYGKGKGKFVSNAEHKSDYFISAVLPFDNSVEECCMEKYGKWISGSMGAQGYTGLKNSIAAHLTLWQPWSTIYDTNNDGNYEVTSIIGQAFQTEQCTSCGIDPITGIGVNSNGLNLGSDTRPAVFYWNGQTGVNQYTVKVYNQAGVLVATKTTTNTSARVNLPAGDYSYEIIAQCINGNTEVSNRIFFTVKPTKLEANHEVDFVKFKTQKQLNDESLLSLTIAPNPSSERTVISVGEVEKGDQILLEVYHISGAKVFSDMITKSNFELNVSDWTPGVYICRVINKRNQSSKVKQLIKK